MDNNTLYKFYSNDCQPCKQLSAIMSGMEFQFPVESIDIYKEDNIKLARACGIRAVPTLVYMDTNGNPHSKTGMMSKESLQNWLDSIQ